MSALLEIDRMGFSALMNASKRADAKKIGADHVVAQVMLVIVLERIAQLGDFVRLLTRADFKSHSDRVRAYDRLREESLEPGNRFRLDHL